MLKDTLLVEIGTEELPPKALKQLAQSLLAGVEAGLTKANLTFGQTQWFATPRRLAFKICELDTQQADQEVEKRGPALSAAFDSEGNPTKAAQGWARANGIEVSDAQKLETDKGAWLLHKAQIKGQSTASLIPGILADSVKQLPIPKPMRWGWSDVSFIRPVHNVLVMLGASTVEGELFGLAFNNQSFGHRFHSNVAFEVTPDNYVDMLVEHKVLADFNARTDAIEKGLTETANSIGSHIEADRGLLEEVTALVEWPVVLLASFDEAFLEVPKEALIYTMKGDQKYFPLLDGEGKLTNQFAFVSNIESSDPNAVISGNEKVIRPRLADAKFFYDMDSKETLETRLDSLKNITFQNKLGSVYDRSVRLSELAGFIASELGEDNAHAKRAGLLAKCDLVSKMVYEFPEVQGVMGFYYALNDGEAREVADAIQAQYLPKFAGDKIPSDVSSVSLALAEKLDTLTGIFGIGMTPKGDKDPFALRRAAIGVIRLITENALALPLSKVLNFASSLFGDKLSEPDTHSKVLQFILGRCQAFYSDAGVPVKVIHAVLATSEDALLDIDLRVKAVSAFNELESSASLASANKRVANILSKNAYSSKEDVNVNLFAEAAESELYNALCAVSVENLKTLSDYEELLNALSELRPQVDAFFDSVMVMVDDDALRSNRLALLAQMRQTFLTVADIALLD